MSDLVYTLSDHIRIRPASGTWVIRAQGAIIGETARALELTEGRSAPVIYVPREDMAMAFLEPSARHSVCPCKGRATYFSVVVPGGTLADAVWSYETPLESAAPIAGYLAFYPDLVKVEPA
ncbi:MAG: DUF427 domain-containing protein [Paracoccaceae bacterium]|nr:DUF427 domain-containing protein [Paracoccaceae bacterium]